MEENKIVQANQVLIAAVILRFVYILFGYYYSRDFGVAFVIGAIITGFFVYLFYKRIKWGYYLQAVLAGLGILSVFINYSVYNQPFNMHRFMILLFAGALLVLCIYIINNFDKLKKKHHPK